MRKTSPARTGSSAMSFATSLKEARSLDSTESSRTATGEKGGRRVRSRRSVLFKTDMASATVLSPVTVSQKTQHFRDLSADDEMNYFRTIARSGADAGLRLPVWRDNRCRSPAGPKPG